MRPAPPKKERVELDPLVEVLVLKEMTANFEVRSQGTVRPKTETILSAEVSGTITEMSPKFVAGGVFDKNEILARIDPTNYDVAFKQAEAMVELRRMKPNSRPLRQHLRPPGPSSFGLAETSRERISGCLMRGSSDPRSRIWGSSSIPVQG
jgi:hypothetical protein